MKKLYDVEIVVCPELISKQKQTLLSLIDHIEDWGECSDEALGHLDGLLNLLDAIEDQVNNLAN
ncbi:MAG: hypothetical protein ACO29Z_04260 [Crocinitomicaceae bacterium]